MATFVHCSKVAHDQRKHMKSDKIQNKYIPDGSYCSTNKWYNSPWSYYASTNLTAVWHATNDRYLSRDLTTTLHAPLLARDTSNNTATALMVDAKYSEIPRFGIWRSAMKEQLLFMKMSFTTPTSVFLHDLMVCV